MTHNSNNITGILLKSHFKNSDSMAQNLVEVLKELFFFIISRKNILEGYHNGHLPQGSLIVDLMLFQSLILISNTVSQLRQNFFF